MSSLSTKRINTPHNYSKTIEEINNDLKDNTKTLIVFVIGRFNPPHGGHMATVMAAIILARLKGGKALILLGDGPEKTIDSIEDPLDFDMKKQIIEQHIPDEYKGYYEIIQKKYPLLDIDTFIKKQIKDEGNIPYILHITGDKQDKGENDATKQTWIYEYLGSKKNKQNEEIGRGYTHVYSHAIEPIKTYSGNMSATQIRRDVVNGDEVQFVDKYGEFYKNDMAGEVYKKIYEAYDNSPIELQVKYSKELQVKYSKESPLKKQKTKGGTRKRTNKRKKTSKRVYKSIAK